MARVIISSTSSFSTRKLLGSTSFWIGFGIFCWYFPRSILHAETSISSLQPPYQKTADGSVIVDFELNQPLVHPPTVDNPLLRGTAIWIPLIILLLHSWYGRAPNFGNDTASGNSKPKRLQKVYLAATVVSAFFAAIGLSEGFTVMIKLWVQRLRPNFYALCGFDYSTLKCMADLERVREAHLSFPSGHSSLISSGMTFLVWYGHGARARSTSQYGEMSRFFSLIICTCLPLAWALFVAASRLVDHWHHPSDVLAGLGLGFTASTIAYHHWYPPVWSSYAGIPRSLLITKITTGFDDIEVKQQSQATISRSSMLTTANTKRRQLQTQSSEDAV